MKFSWPSHRVTLALVLIAALAARLAACAWWQSRLPAGSRFAFGDSETYWSLAQSLAHGEAYQYGSSNGAIFRMPGYPWLLSLVFRCVGDDPSVLWARGLSALLGTGTVAGVYALGRQIFDSRTGLVAAALAAGYPGAIGMSVFVLSEAPFCLLYVAQLVALAAAWQDRGWRSVGWAAGAGALAGLATLVRPSWLAFVPFLLCVGLLTRDRRRHAVLGLASLAALSLMMLPWWIRNYRIVGHFVPTTLQMGASLYDGLNPEADGSSNMAFVRKFQDIEHVESLTSREPFEYRLDRRLTAEALRWAATHPARVAQLAAIKFARMWNVWPNDRLQSSWTLRLVTLATYAPLLALSLAGAWRFRAMGWLTALCWLPAVYFTILHMVFVSSIRYREPAMAPLLALAAATITQGLRPSSKD